MNKIPTISVRQTRGSWVATVGSYGAHIFGFETLPVMRDFKNGEWSYNQVVSYYVDLSTSTDGAWWLKPKHQEWRRLLEDLRIVYVRSGTKDSSKSGTVGNPIGIFKISELIITQNQFSLQREERIANVKL